MSFERHSHAERRYIATIPVLLPAHTCPTPSCRELLPRSTGRDVAPPPRDVRVLSRDEEIDALLLEQRAVGEVEEVREGEFLQSPSQSVYCLLRPAKATCAWCVSLNMKTNDTHITSEVLRLAEDDVVRGDLALERGRELLHARRVGRQAKHPASRPVSTRLRPSSRTDTTAMK